LDKKDLTKVRNRITLATPNDYRDLQQEVKQKEQELSDA